MKKHAIILMLICIGISLNGIAQNKNGYDKYGMPKFPKGTILMWYNADIPAGWAICDGKNGTPDLSNRYPSGTTDYSKLGAKTGNSSVQIQTSQITDVNDHSTGGAWSNGAFQTTGDHRAKHQHIFTLKKEDLPLPTTTVFFIMKL